MPDYKNTPEGFIEVRKQLLLKLTPLLLIAVVGGLAISYFNGDKKDGALTWLIMLILVLVFLIYGVAKGIQMQKGIYDSYILTIASDHLSRRQLNMPTVTIFFSEITKINEDKTGNLVVTDDKHNQVIISGYVQNYEQIKSLLQSAKPISPTINKGFFQKYPLLLPFVTVGLMAVVYLSNNKIVVGLCGIVFIGAMMWAFYKIRTSEQLDNRVKRSSLWMILVIVSVAIMIYYKVFGF